MQNSFTDTIKGLRYNTTYYIRSFATNQAGTAYGPETQVRTQNTIYTIGQSFAGGKIFHIDSTGDHGLVYFAAYNYTHYPWAILPHTNILVGGTSEAMGTGKTNTLRILASGNTGAGTAARICDDFVSGGYTDWFLPSRVELLAIKASVSIFDISGSAYWSSSEALQNKAYFVMINGISSIDLDQKTEYFGVIPVREF
ncbi:MAG: hypothetical protein IPH18_00565 [Chitinophagaceae bacterium]|nr:hypothetical protein [Chitinophagaceae bacterium]